VNKRTQLRVLSLVLNYNTGPILMPTSEVRYKFLNVHNCNDYIQETSSPGITFCLFKVTTVVAVTVLH
jgi:hypothetical protein